MHANFESIESKYQELICSPEFSRLVEMISTNKKVYIIGNGGLHYVGSHMATDLTRLVPHLVAKSFDSFGFITSSANDHGWDNIFVNWLETSSILDDPDSTFVYGMSCSGNSTNVIKALDYASSKLNFNTFLFCGRPNKSPLDCPVLCAHADFYHTVETLGLMLFYEIIHRAGYACPNINR